MYIYFNNEGKQIGTSSNEGVSLAEATTTLFNADYKEENIYSLVNGEMVGVIKPEPTQAQLDSDNAIYQATKYQQDRQYPSLEEQADMQYHDAINGTTVWVDTITAVKDANPKPTNA